MGGGLKNAFPISEKNPPGKIWPYPEIYNERYLLLEFHETPLLKEDNSFFTEGVNLRKVFLSLEWTEKKGRLLLPLLRNSGAKRTSIRSGGRRTPPKGGKVGILPRRSPKVKSRRRFESPGT